MVDALGGTTALGNLNYFTITAAGNGTEQITVVHWNIHKGREECGDPHSACANTLDLIATYISAKGADVVSLNEVAFNRPGYVDSNGHVRRPVGETLTRNGAASSTTFVVSETIKVDGCSASSSG